MKNLNKLTLKEFEQYNELLNEKDIDVFSIMELFGVKNPETLSVEEYTKIWEQISSMSLSLKGVKREYNINGKRFKADLNIHNLTAGQFIDLQNYMKNYKLHEVLSIFLIPMYKSKFLWKTHNYNDGYDILEVQEYLHNNMEIGEANELAAFFLKISEDLLKIIVNYSQKKLMKMRQKRIKELEKKLIK